MQPQSYAQMVVNMVDYAPNAQASLDAPRRQGQQGRTLLLEDGVPRPIVDGLAPLGHNVKVDASDQQADGCAVGFRGVKRET